MHSPLPWIISESSNRKKGLLIKPNGGQVIAECDLLPNMQANAEFIVTACNVYDLWEAALRLVLKHTLGTCDCLDIETCNAKIKSIVADALTFKIKQ